MSRLQNLINELFPDKRVRYQTFAALGAAAFFAWCSVSYFSRKSHLWGFVFAAAVYAMFWLLYKYVVKRIPER